MSEYTQEDLDNINDAILSGVMTVTIKGRSVSYRSLADLLTIKKMIQKDLGVEDTNSRISLVKFDGRV